MSYVPTYFEVEEEIVNATLNLSNYVTQKEFKSLTNVATSDFALKTNAAEIKKKVDDIDVDKIDFIDELQGKKYVEDSYLYLNQKYKYFKYDKTDTQKLLSGQSAEISNEKLTPIKDTNSPSLLSEKTKPYLKISFFKFLAQRKIYTHKSIVNIYIVYLMPDITDVKGSDLLKYGLFGATGYDPNNKLVGYGVGFGTQKYTHDDGKEARNVVIPGTNSNALVLGKGSIKVTTNDSAAIQTKDKLKTNCKIPNKKFILSVHYDATDDNSESFLFINSVQQYKLKADKNEIVARKSNLGSISDNSVLHYSHTLNGNIYSFSVDYELPTIDKIQKIHKYLMKKHNI